MSSKAIWYKSPDTAQKQKRAERFNSLNSAQEKRAEWYRSLNPEEKEKLLSGRAEWYKTLDPADEDRIISQVQANKEAHRNSVQHDIDHKITAFQSKIREGSYYIFSVCNRILYRKTVIQLKNKCTKLSKTYLLSCIPMIPFRLGMTYHPSPDDNLFSNRCMLSA